MENENCQEQNPFPQTYEDLSGNVPIAYFAVEPDFDEKTFQRNMLIEMTATPSCPEDVVYAEFGKTEKFYQHLAMVTCYVNVTYYASVGYNREETYREYDKVNKKYELKKRTVTDWSAFTSTKQDEKTEFVDLDTHEPVDLFGVCELPAEKLISPGDVTFETEIPLAPDVEAVKTGRKQCLRSVGESCRYDLPGDGLKDFGYSGTANLKIVSGIVIPKYRLSYQYNGENYAIERYAAGNSKEPLHFANDSLGHYVTLAKKMHPFMLFADVLTIVTLIALFIFVVPTASGLVDWTSWVKPFQYLAICATAISLIYFIFVKHTYRKRDKNLLSSAKKQKIEYLELRLRKLGMEPLSAAEREYIEKKYQTATFDAVAVKADKEKMNSQKGTVAQKYLSAHNTALFILIADVILAFIGLISTFFY